MDLWINLVRLPLVTKINLEKFHCMDGLYMFVLSLDDHDTLQGLDSSNAVSTTRFSSYDMTFS
jgi:hypothetical protein